MHHSAGVPRLSVGTLHSEYASTRLIPNNAHHTSFLNKAHPRGVQDEGFSAVCDQSEAAAKIGPHQAQIGTDYSRASCA